jgi:hypothetical protein
MARLESPAWRNYGAGAGDFLDWRIIASRCLLIYEGLLAPRYGTKPNLVTSSPLATKRMFRDLLTCSGTRRARGPLGVYFSRGVRKAVLAFTVVRYNALLPCNALQCRPPSSSGVN